MFKYRTLLSTPGPTLYGMSVFLRADTNTPLTDSHTIADRTRLDAVLPSLTHLLSGGARVTLASHLGRPSSLPDGGGELPTTDPSSSMAVIADALAESLGPDTVFFAPSSSCVAEASGRLRDSLSPGTLCVVENTRFHAGETENDPQFARALARGSDLMVTDAFGVAHRAHASNVGVAQHVRAVVAGACMDAELKALYPLLHGPDTPFAAVLGGAKVSSKLPLLSTLLPKLDTICIGGAMAFTLLKATGVDVGASMVEDELVSVARDVLGDAKDAGVDVLLPLDLVVAKDPEATKAEAVVTIEEGVPEGWCALDIGPKTLHAFGAALGPAKTVFWNGPMGRFEVPAFAQGTHGMASLLADKRHTNGFTVVGGGDSVSAVTMADLTEFFSHVSTGGGASMELLEGKTLPGVAILHSE